MAAPENSSGSGMFISMDKAPRCTFGGDFNGQRLRSCENTASPLGTVALHVQSCAVHHRKVYSCSVGADAPVAMSTSDTPLSQLADKYQSVRPQITAVASAALSQKVIVYFRFSRDLNRCLEVAMVIG